MDTLIESLPSEDNSQELQVQALKRLELENEAASEQLEKVVLKGEMLLEKIQAALSDIAKSQIESKFDACDA